MSHSIFSVPYRHQSIKEDLVNETVEMNGIGFSFSMPAESVAYFAPESLSSASSPLARRETFSIFPNPAHDFLGISGKNWQSAILYNACGQPVRQYSAGENMSLSGLPAGLYFVEVYFSDGAAKSVFRLVKL